ncbi:MAG: hypothetical protein ACX939_11680, partial [Hyphococcus sp.]
PPRKPSICAVFGLVYSRCVLGYDVASAQLGKTLVFSSTLTAFSTGSTPLFADKDKPLEH